MKQVLSCNSENRDYVLNLLRRDPIANGLAIQDLRVWPENTKVFFSEEPFSYLHVSGHPAYHGSQTISLGGDSKMTTELLSVARPDAPFTVRETGAEFTAAIKSYYPNVKIYEEMRMDVTRETFQPKHTGQARQLNEGDLLQIAKFFGAPPEAAGKFMGWIKGAKALLGVFEGQTLVAMGSSFISLPETWNLVGIATHKDYRGKGYATEVTSSLTARALENTNTVTVTVVSDNVPAIRTYEKLGYKRTQDRIWADCGSGSKP